MMNFNSQNQAHLETITSDIWNIFNILRHENIKPEDYHVVLFFLSIYKDGLINEEFFLRQDYPISIWINRQISNSDTSSYFELKELYGDIYIYFEPIINKISDHSLRYVFHTLFRLDYLDFSQNFADIYDSILYKIAASQGRSVGNYIQPYELTSLMLSLADLKDDAKVYNPFAGLASFGVFLKNSQKYFAQEIIRETWALGRLRLHAHKKSAENFSCESSIDHWPNVCEKFDLVISNPPFGIRLFDHNNWNNYNVRTTSDEFLIREGVKSLNNEGKLIAVIPPKTLFSGGSDLRLRKFLIDEDLLDTIIALPGGLLLNSGMPLIIIVINRAKKNFGKVKFIDAKNFVTNIDSRLKVLDSAALNNFLKDGVLDDSILRNINVNEIRENEYNLHVSRYFKKNVEGVRLGDLIEILNTGGTDLPETGKLIRVRDLKDDNVDFILDESTLEDSVLKKNNAQQIFESCLLMATRWKTLKPTFVEFKGGKIYKSSDVLAVRVNQSKVEEAYLINELQSEYVKQQVDSYRLGSTIPFIRQNDLLEVKIKLPSLEEQRAKAEGIYELANKIKNLQIERNALAHGKAINDYDEFASLKHTLGRPRQNILDWSDNLLAFLNSKEEDLQAINKEFIEFYEVDIISVLKEIKRDVNFITEVLEKGENGLVLSAYQKKVIPLSDLNSIINDLSNNGFNFKIKKLSLKTEGMKERGIIANRVLLKTLLDNILTNANKYGFDIKNESNEVVIELSEIDDFLIVEIKNNGKPFPKNFDREKFIAKYSTADITTGSGLGGYDIHRIATYFENTNWELILNVDPIYPVHFKFQFPLKSVN